MAQSLRRAYIIGVGMTKFTKPGIGLDYPEMAQEAVQAALTDARLNYKEVQQGVVGYVYGDSTCGQRALYTSGLTGIPIYNVNNNCATGSSALYLAKQLVAGNQAQCVLALGFEKMEKGSLGISFPSRTNPLDKHVEAMIKIRGITEAPVAAQLFGSAGKEHMNKYGTTIEHFAKVALKNHNHGAKNKNSQFQKVRTLEEVIEAQVVSTPLTKLMCCPTSDGAAAALVASEEFVKTHNLEETAVEILGMEMVTDLPSTFEENSMEKVVGYDMTKTAARLVFQKSGRKVSEVNAVELHDCFSANELITYEALGLCEEGKAGEFIDRGDNTYGGKFVVNPSGGLISKGHPLGATGLAQVTELCWQLRGKAGERQIQDCKLALAHNLGLGGAVVVSLLQMGFPGVKNTSTPTGDQPFYKASSSKTETGSPKDSNVTSDFVARVFDQWSNVLKSAGKPYVINMNGIYESKVEWPGDVGPCILDVKNGIGGIECCGSGHDGGLTFRGVDLHDVMPGKLDAPKVFSNKAQK